LVSSTPNPCRLHPCFYFKTFSEKELCFKAFLANPLMMLSQKNIKWDGQAKSAKCKARLSSHEAYLRTSKQRDNCSNAAVVEFLRRHLSCKKSPPGQTAGFLHLIEGGL
jgi:hypothetical protein